MTRLKNTGFDQLSEIICKAIEDEPFFSKEVLIPKVKSIMTAFRLNLAVSNYNKIETPTNTAKLLKTLEKVQCEKTFWCSEIRKLNNEQNMKKFYDERDEFLKNSGF